MVENNKYRIVYSVASLIEKRLSQTGVWIRFDSALSDPALCTGLSLARDKYVITINVRLFKKLRDIIFFCGTITL
jgi:hypothetical protein